MKLILALIPIALWLAVTIGWVMNVVALIGMLSGSITALLLARAVGVFVFPLGAVLGLFV